MRPRHWHRPVLGGLWTTCCCTRDTAQPDYYETNALTNFAHDVRCHGWRTAFYNLWIRLRAPCWFVDCDAENEEPDGRSPDETLHSVQRDVPGDAGVLLPAREDESAAAL